MECRLKRGGTVIGIIKPEPSWFDFPWHAGHFSPTEAFSTVSELFEEEARLTDSDADAERFDKIWAVLNEPGLELEYDDGTVKHEILMHIAGGRADWREA